MVVHPAVGNYDGTLVNALLSYCDGKLSDINGVIRPGIVHRIDKDTTGILVVAKNNNAHEKLSELFKVHDKNVHYFGRKPLDEIKKYLPNIDYCLMPSEFLETFWLSALNALSWWVPVIWYKKWWLEPFIFQECNLFLAKWNTTAERIVSIVEKLAKKTNPERIKYKEELELAKQIAVTRATSEDSSMNFLDNEIPGAFNNPLNYI